MDKRIGKVIGSVELFHRTAEDDFNHAGVLRLNVGSVYETADVISDVMKLVIPSALELFDCEEINVPSYAAERTEAAKKAGFEKTDRLLIGTMDGYARKDYRSIRK